MKIVPFNFDEWMKLHQEDPEAFEQKRRGIKEILFRHSLRKRKQQPCSLKWSGFLDNTIRF